MPGSYTLSIIMPRCVITEHPMGMSGRGRQTVELSGMARFHVGSATSADVALVTTVQSA